MEMEVLYEGEWWPTHIKFKHRDNAVYVIVYNDDEGCKDANVSSSHLGHPVIDDWQTQ